MATNKEGREIVYKIGINHHADSERCNRCWMGVLMDNKTPECHTYCEYEGDDLEEDEETP